MDEVQNRFRDPEAGRRLLQQIRALVPGNAAEPIRLMEVCGTHTMSIARYGLRSLLPPGLKLVSGPGCPVCVTPTPYLDAVIDLLRTRADVTAATFGDMLRVPGSAGSLQELRARGGKVKVVYSPMEALALAAAQPGDEVVFLGVGFETTAPTVAAAIREADRLDLRNFSVLSGHKIVMPALDALSALPDLRVSGFILPGHVSVILGSDAYRPLAAQRHVPCVVTGFEPVDILLGVRMLLAQAREGRAEVENAYARVVRPEGNRLAWSLIEDVFEPCDTVWRGLGAIPASGLAPRPRYARYDAALRFGLDVHRPEAPSACRCGQVLTGAIDPPQCPLFGTVCTPQKPVGACMVSSEGSCAAWFQHQG